MLITAAAILAIIYLAGIVFLRAGLERAARREAGEAGEPVVSVIVAARNEERDLGRCLESLLALEYPAEKLEIIVVNDHSTDGTRAVAEAFAQGRHLVRVIDSTTGSGALRGKANALAQGIDASRGEILMFTDADCVVAPTWVRSTVASFSGSVGIVGGFTLLNADTAFHGIQMLDWVYLFGLASAMAGWRRPLTVVGNNLSVRRSAYDAVGGYRSIPFSVTEDYALVRTILRQTTFTVAFPPEKRSVVESQACESFSHLFRQKQRWGVGGLDMVWLGNLVMLLFWLARLVLLAAAVWQPSLPVLVAGCALLAADLRFLSVLLRKFDRLKELRHFVLFEVYLTLYGLLLPFVAFFSKRVIWKERTL